MSEEKIDVPGDAAESLDQAHAAARETARLASFILDKFPDEPGSIGDSESAVDVAIRIMEREQTARERVVELQITLDHFRQRFGELATAARELVASIGSRNHVAFHKLEAALPEPKNTPVQLATSIKSIEKAAAVCAMLADFAELEGAADVEGPSEILSFLNDAVRLALEARGEAGPGEAPGFKVGRCYSHPGGEEIMVVGRALTIMYGDCLVGESNKSSELKPLGKDADAMQNWVEITREHFALNFGD